MATIRSVGEFGLIQRVTSALVMPPMVSVGPGDDAACLLVDGSCVVSTDMYVDGVHFRRDWCSAEDIGHKVVAAATADIEAMGANQLAVLVALGLPRDTDEEWVRDFNVGLQEECDSAGTTLVGGDMSNSTVITITVTVIGETGAVEPVLRDGALPGQVVAMVGRLGWSSAGLAALGRGFRSPKAVVDAYRRPQVPYGAGRMAALAGATAMIDVSDGLLADLGHIAERSGVLIDVDASSLSVAQPVVDVGNALVLDPLMFVLTGGEDHAMVATFEEDDVPAHWDVIGHVLTPITAPPGTVLVDGQEWIGPTAGWNHF